MRLASGVVPFALAALILVAGPWRARAAEGDAASAAAAKEAASIFASRCSLCHGMGGKGDGSGAAGLNPKPRDYTDARPRRRGAIRPGWRRVPPW